MKADDRDKRTIRLPRALNARLAVLAVQNGHSINAEIIQRLRASLEERWR